MSNDKTANGARHHEKTTATFNTHGTGPTQSTKRRAWHPVPGMWEMTLAEKTSADCATGRPTLIPNATLAVARPNGAVYPSGTRHRVVVAFDVTHVKRRD